MALAPAAAKLSSARADRIRARILALPARLRPEAADGLAAEWEIRVGDEVFTVSVADGVASSRLGQAGAPTSRVTTDPDTWLAIDDGSLTGVEAFLSRRLAVRGNVDLAVRLQALFRPHRRARRPADLEQIHTTADEVGLSAYVVGRGPAVLLLHGLGGSKISWLPAVPALALRYRLIVPDLPGHGESDKPRTKYTPRFYARVVRRLLDELEVPRAAVVGNSLGGRVALELASRSPDRVTGVGLLGAAIPGYRVRAVLGLARVIPPSVGRIPFPLGERWMQLAIRRLFGDAAALPEAGYAAAADEFVRVYRDPAARIAFFDSLRHLVSEPARPFWARARRIRAPALVLWGTRDRLVPVRLASRLAEALPRAEMVLLPGVGHVPQFEAPAETMRELARFLAEVERGIGP